MNTFKVSKGVGKLTFFREATKYQNKIKLNKEHIVSKYSIPEFLFKPKIFIPPFTFLKKSGIKEITPLSKLLDWYHY